MDETPAFFDMASSKCVTENVRGIVWSVSQGVKKKTVFLSAITDGQMLTTMIIFKGKTEQTIRDLNIPLGFIAKTQKKARMDDDLIKVWTEEIWLKYTQAECKRLGFENSLLSLDDFAAHLTDGIKAQLLESNYDILPILAGCTSKCQPIDVSLSKPFKAVLRRC